MAGRSILDVFSTEIVELVVQEVNNGDKKRVCDLRLVCKTLNELVEPQVFASVAIQFVRDDDGKWKKIPAFLSSLALGTSPYVRWAKDLRIRLLVASDVSSSGYHSWQHTERETMLVCQREWLTPAIESLVQVERASFEARTGEPCYEVVCALARLPHLQDLDMILSYRRHEYEDIPLAKFSHLISIQLIEPMLTPYIVEELQGLLASSPSLTELTITPGARCEKGEMERVELGSLFENAMQGPAELNETRSFSPTLRKLTLPGKRFNLSPSCMPFLHALTSLTILDDSTHALPSFWKTLQDAGVHLEELNVGSLLQPIVNYLLLYSGLREFTLGWSHTYGWSDTRGWSETPDDVERIAHQFFHSVLPMHRASMQTIAFRGLRWDPGPWPVTQSYLEQGVYLCKNLKYLGLIYYFPSPNEKHTHPVLPMPNLLSGISENLPRLRTLQLEYTRKFRDAFGWTFGYSEYLDSVARVFANQIINNSPFHSHRQPQFQLEAAKTTLISTPVESATGSQRGQYRFKLLFDDPDLKLDGDVYDFDADPESDEDNDEYIGWTVFD